MTRELLPPRRKSETHKIRIKGIRSALFVNIGFYPDGRVGEIFLDTDREGAGTRDIFHAFALIVSLALQHGVSIEEIQISLKYFSGVPKAVSDLLKQHIEEKNATIQS